MEMGWHKRLPFGSTSEAAQVALMLEIADSKHFAVW